MLICPKCGSENRLGRVICVKCGAHLGIEDLVPDDPKRARRSPRSFRALKRIVAVLILGAVALLATALFPTEATIGVRGVPADARRVYRQLQVAGELEEGRSLRIILLEKGLNAYLAAWIATQADMENLSVDTGEDMIRVRWVRKLADWKVKSLRIAPRLCFDLTFELGGEAIELREARLGRLPLPGPAKTVAFSQLRELLSDLPGHAIIPHIVDVKAKDEGLSLLVRK